MPANRGYNRPSGGGALGYNDDMRGHFIPN